VSRTVYLHVGIAKTGTTYLQRTLYANRALLERGGTRYPGPGRAAHFFGSLDLRGTTFQGHADSRVKGAWGRLVAQADAFAGDTLISHETLAHADADQIQCAVTGFDTDDVRVVITCRDLGRQLPAMWQEKVKNRSTTRYSAFLSRVFADWARDGGPTGSFWRAQHVEGLVRRWADAVGIDNIRVVTVPPPGADRQELWNRFARATCLPDLDYVFAEDGGNTSLGVAEAEMLRRLNPLLEDVLDWPRYDVLVKKWLAVNVLARVHSSDRLGVPAGWHQKILEVTDSAVQFLEHAGVTVVGDPQDLRPDLTGAPSRQPADLDDAELLEVALRVVASLLVTPPDVVSGEEHLRPSSLRLSSLGRTLGRVGRRLGELRWAARHRARTLSRRR